MVKSLARSDLRHWFGHTTINPWNRAITLNNPYTTSWSQVTEFRKHFLSSFSAPQDGHTMGCTTYPSYVTIYMMCTQSASFRLFQISLWNAWINPCWHVKTYFYVITCIWGIDRRLIDVSESSVWVQVFFFQKSVNWYVFRVKHVSATCQHPFPSFR